jgi:hypothetical protein
MKRWGKGLGLGFLRRHSLPGGKHEKKEAGKEESGIGRRESGEGGNGRVLGKWEREKGNGPRGELTGR